MMKIEQYIGLFDTKEQLLIWKAPISRAMTIREGYADKINNPNLCLVWLHIKYSFTDPQTCTIVRVLTGEVLMDEYPMISTISVTKFKLTTQGVAYLKLRGKTYKEGETISLILLQYLLRPHIIKLDKKAVLVSDCTSNYVMAVRS